MNEPLAVVLQGRAARKVEAINAWLTAPLA